MKKALVIRLGAFGDMLIITPELKKLKELGYYVFLNTGKRGMDVFKNNPNVDEYVIYDDEKPPESLEKYWDGIKARIDPDLFINFSESLECNVALHPIQPEYNYTKAERYALANKNYYDATEDWLRDKAVFKGEPEVFHGFQKVPELFFTEEEKDEARGLIKAGKFNVLWQLSGSAKQKVYPWTDFVIGEVLKNYDNIHFITTGDERCQMLESMSDPGITNLSGRIPVRTAMCLTQFVDLVIAPDTGILHASGCYETPKIGILGHTSKVNITAYFKNDYSLEAICACAPCFRLIYDFDIQCPIELVSHAAWCMAEGIKPERLYDAIAARAEVGGYYRRVDAGKEAGIS